MDMDPAERKDCEEKAKLAQDTFRAMFRGNMDNEQFLIEDPEDVVLEILRSWIQDADHSEIGRREVRLTLKDCSSFLMRLTSEQISAQEPAVWPYVRKIKFVYPMMPKLIPQTLIANNCRVFLKAHILKTGLVLVDLPG